MSYRAIKKIALPDFDAILILVRKLKIGLFLVEISKKKVGNFFSKIFIDDHSKKIFKKNFKKNLFFKIFFSLTNFSKFILENFN